MSKKKINITENDKNYLEMFLKNLTIISNNMNLTVSKIKYQSWHQLEPQYLVILQTNFKGMIPCQESQYTLQNMIKYV